MGTNNEDFEYFQGPIISGTITYSFPVEKPAKAIFTLFPFNDQDIIKSERIYPIKQDDEDDEFLFRGAL